MGGHIMNADDLKKLTTESLKQLAALLEQGQSERLTSLLKTMARFHRYSLHNVCLIVSQRPTATRVAGFHTWRGMGRFVRKGEKGIAILAPIVRRRREGEGEDDEPRAIVGFRAAYVFDVAQTDGAPLPEIAAVGGNPGERTVALKAAIGRSEIQLEYADDLGGALGLSCGGRIRVLNGLSAASEFLVIAHEYAYELLHRSSDRPESRDTRELEAEAVGLDIADAARDYIQLYRGDAAALPVAGNNNRISKKLKRLTRDLLCTTSWKNNFVVSSVARIHSQRSTTRVTSIAKWPTTSFGRDSLKWTFEPATRCCFTDHQVQARRATRAFEGSVRVAICRRNRPIMPVNDRS
jgi:N-terminal domain of anti-restriction factor ArdC